ncbi:MAG TPA: histidine phosphatase family protein [Ktedonobacteraceae bacterium]|nr:histidine phosphatase family protein [Ktedonobacteraceae bacterium]
MSINEQDPFLLQRGASAELYLIRHGDAIPEADEIIPSGLYDDLPLSKTGREQAQALAARFMHMPFAAAYRSPLERCKETSAPLLTALGMSATVVEDIKEIHLPRKIELPTLQADDDLVPLSKAIRAAQAETTRIAAASGTWDAVSDRETSKDFRRRVVTALDAIARQHSGERVLVFTHGGVINAYAAEVLGLERDFFFPCANTSITLVRSNGEQRVLYIMNDIAHLKLS